MPCIRAMAKQCGGFYHRLHQLRQSLVVMHCDGSYHQPPPWCSYLVVPLVVLLDAKRGPFDESLSTMCVRMRILLFTFGAKWLCIVAGPATIGSSIPGARIQWRRLSC